MRRAGPKTATAGFSTGPVALATFIDPAAAEDPLGDYSASINWGDKTTSAGVISYNGQTGFFTVKGAHTYAAPGTYAAPVITIHHETTTTVVTDTSRVTVGGETLTARPVTYNGIEGRLVPGTVASFTDSKTNALASQFTASVNWGDGQTTAGTIVPDGGGRFHVAASHAYLEEKAGGYPLVVTIHNTKGPGMSCRATPSLLTRRWIAVLALRNPPR